MPIFFNNSNWFAEVFGVKVQNNVKGKWYHRRIFRNNVDSQKRNIPLVNGKVQSQKQNHMDHIEKLVWHIWQSFLRDMLVSDHHPSCPFWFYSMLLQERWHQGITRISKLCEFCFMFLEFWLLGPWRRIAEKEREEIFGKGKHIFLRARFMSFLYLF